MDERPNNCEPTSEELTACTAPLSPLEVKLSLLQAELSERIVASELLTRRIDSIRASICWRLTWPIRWLDAQVNWARSTSWQVSPVWKIAHHLLIVGH
jgi:hypothetical protein